MNWTDRRTDTLMEVYKFRSGLMEVTGDGTYICITRSQICFETLTNNSPSRAAFSQLKISIFWRLTIFWDQIFLET